MSCGCRTLKNEFSFGTNSRIKLEYDMKTEFYSIGGINDEQFDFAVICAAYKGKWLFVRHRDRNTWEIPGSQAP